MPVTSQIFNPEATFVRLEVERQPDVALLNQATMIGDIALRRVIILGIPGAGKTTLVEALHNTNPKINYISLGEISRNLDPDSMERKALDDLFAVGSPVGPSDLFLDLLEPHIDSAMGSGGGFILDGMPKKEAEVGPLLNFLAAKRATPEAIISCEVNAVVAYSRVLERPDRDGDPDNMEVFLNRTQVYLRSLENFKERLGNGGVPLLVVDTEKHSAASASFAINAIAKSSEAKPKFITKETATALIAEALAEHDDAKALNTYGVLFDDLLPEIDHAKACAIESDDDRLAYIEVALLLSEPSLKSTPLFLERLASNYIKTTLMSVSHLYESLQEELQLRHNGATEFSSADVADIFNQQLRLKTLIDTLQEEIIANESIESLTAKEAAANISELSHIENILKTRAVELGVDPADVSALDLMKLQPKLWGQLTSNQTIFSQDLNYRREANGIPGSHHSLLPFTKNKRAMSANSMGDYVPFIEAVSASENKYSSTFGFIHFIGMDDAGVAFGVEYPIMMHDSRLLALDSPIINRVLIQTDAFYGNHDLWHNLLPVFSKSFILHHPDAPLSYGDRLPGYLEFGNGLRSEKEEYEIGVAMAHATTQQERFRLDSKFEAQQTKLLIDSLESLKMLPEELRDRCDPVEAQGIVDYLACSIATKAYNVFPDNHQIYGTIERHLIELGVKQLEITSVEVSALLLSQGLLDKNKAAEIAGLNIADIDMLESLIREDPQFSSKLIKDCIDSTIPGRESGAEHIVGALRRWGVIATLADEPTAKLGVLDKSRWLAMTAPQRKQLKGHMEKVHGKSGYLFNSTVISDPRDLVLVQKQALGPDMAEYEYRMGVRRENQELGYRLYSLMFDDDQDVERLSRAELELLRKSSDTGQKLFANEALLGLDKLLDSLVKNTYSAGEDLISYLDSYAESLEIGENNKLALNRSIKDILDKYRELSQRELVHQQQRGISYADSARKINDEHMDIA